MPEVLLKKSVELKISSDQNSKKVGFPPLTSRQSWNGECHSDCTMTPISGISMALKLSEHPLELAGILWHPPQPTGARILYRRLGRVQEEPDDTVYVNHPASLLYHWECGSMPEWDRSIRFITLDLAYPPRSSQFCGVYPLDF